jgi:N6-L-threonylcarbamoyladenine synthase
MLPGCLKHRLRNCKPMLVLGIETTCDETGAALIERHDDGSGVILSNVVLSQIADHAAFGGVVPEIAARAHVEALDAVIATAMRQGGCRFAELDGVASAAGPGLIGGVIVGLTTAKAIAIVHEKPLIAVNHLEGHALTARLTDSVPFPFCLFLASGGHTQIVAALGIGDYVRLGTTRDDAIGEAFDKTAKLLGLGYPGGPRVEQEAEHGDRGRFDLPRPMIGRHDADFSLSGLKTAVRLEAEKIAPLSDADVADLCASFQLAVVEMVVDRLREGLRMFRQRFGAPSALVAAGGVAANQAIRDAILDVALQNQVPLVVPPPNLCSDNAAMIAWAGAERLACGLCDSLDVAPRARWPLTEVVKPTVTVARLTSAAAPASGSAARGPADSITSSRPASMGLQASRTADAPVQPAEKVATQEETASPRPIVAKELDTLLEDAVMAALEAPEIPDTPHKPFMTATPLDQSAISPPGASGAPPPDVAASDAESVDKATSPPETASPDAAPADAKPADARSADADSSQAMSHDGRHPKAEQTGPQRADTARPSADDRGSNQSEAESAVTRTPPPA